MSGSSEHRAALRGQALGLMNGERLDEARALLTDMCDRYPDDAEAWNMLAYVNGRQGNIEAAGECCRRVIALEPDRADAHFYLGNVLAGQGQAAAAAASFRTAVQIKPDFQLAYCNLGNVELQRGRYEEAVDSYGRAVLLDPAADVVKTIRARAQSLAREGRLQPAKTLLAHLCRANPQDVEAWNALANVHGALGEIDEAGDCCRRVLATAPEHSEAHANLGNVYFHYRRFDEAIAQYRRAVQIDPGNIAALNNMGRACQTSAHIADYISQYRRVIGQLAVPDEARAAFSEVMEHAYGFPAAYLPWLDEELQACFSLCDINYQLMGRVAARLLKLKYSLSAQAAGDEAFCRDMRGRIATDRLFLAMLEKAVNYDADLERLLTKLRRELLFDYMREGRLRPGDAGVVLALARQGINNEYVFAVDDEQEGAVADLRRRIDEGSPSPGKDLEAGLLVFGMYERPSSLACAERLADQRPQAWSETFRPFWEEALVNPAEENRIRGEIPALGNVTDEISRLVRSQYEENPYPRWVATATRQSKVSMRSALRTAFPHFDPPPFLGGPVQILIAGCGTGMQAAQAAQDYSDVQILAVDISRSSLAYAARMARRYGLKNITFMQGDILELARLDRRFHYVECIGVLHHMADPLAGWRVLTGLVVEHGLMQIGLYSELARKAVVEARDIIRREGLASDRDSIRRFRARVLQHEYGERLYDLASKSDDFFSTSGCRDLLFHYHEHRYTLARLRREMNELKLAFIGFRGFKDVEVGDRYRRHFPDDRSMNDLDCWERFEDMYPDTFGEMYHFWCQKA